MESRHISIERTDAVALKKEVLNSEVSILEILKRLRSYRLLRKKEFVLRTELKAHFATLHTKVNSSCSSLPEYFPASVEKKFTSAHPRESHDIQKELEDIRAKLQRLE